MATVTTVEAFKSAIDKIRNIFRALTPSITGMDSMRHLCLYLLSRYITKENCESFGIPEKFCWESLYEQATKSGGAEISLEPIHVPLTVREIMNHKLCPAFPAQSHLFNAAQNCAHVPCIWDQVKIPSRLR